MSVNAIAALERGRRTVPRLTTVQALAEALSVAPDDLLGTAPPPPSRPRPPRGAVGNVPVPLSSMVGRRAEIDELADHVLQERLVSLVGPGGVGKTRLALELAAAVRDKFGGGVWWVELGPLRSADAVPGAVLAALGAPEPSNRNAADQVLAALTALDAPVLVLVDNAEHLLDPVAALLEHLLAGLDRLSVVVTSRDPVRLGGELVWRVHPLAVPTVDDPAEVIADADAVRLFADRARRVNRSFLLDDLTAPTIAAICRRLDGLPLAIELAASRCSGLTELEIATQLDDRFELLATDARSTPQRHRAVFGCVEWSYDLLDDGEREVLRSLSPFVGRFDVEAVAQVAGRPGVLGVLLRLVDKSLVASDRDERGRTRYRLLETIRAFAVAKATEHGELERYRDAHLAHQLAWLEAVGALTPDDDTLEEIAARYADLRAALEWAIERRSPAAYQVAVQLSTCWHVLSRFHDAIVLGDGALAIAAEDGDRAWCRTAAAISFSRLIASDAAFVADVLPEALDKAIALGDTWAESFCRLTLGMRPPWDLDQFAAAYDLAVASGAMHVASMSASMSAVALGAGDESDTWLERSLAIAETIGNVSLDGLAAIPQCDQLFEQGRLDEAQELAERYSDDERVTLTVRLLLVGRLVMLALQRLDTDLANRAMVLGLRLARVWNPGGFPGVEMTGKRLALLDGQRPHPGTLESQGSRIGMQVPALRMLCRTAIDLDVPLDPEGLARRAVTSTRGPLLEASVRSVQAARAAVDGDRESAEAHWRVVLALAIEHDYLLLAVDALEGLASLAASAELATRAGVLLGLAAELRSRTGNRFRFTFEQRAVDAAAETGRRLLGAKRWRDALSEGAVTPLGDVDRYLT